MSAELLPFPPPYGAALTISNDIDDTVDPRGWFEFLRYLNTGERTRLGPGLDLELGDSFWMWSDDPEGQPASYFEGLSERRSAFAPFIERLGRAGYLDTLHSYGNFSRHGGFRREMAETALQVFRDQGWAPRVWVNHGGLHDFQNLGLNGCGDVPENPEAEGAPCPEYHLDLTRRAGFRFFWTSELTRVPGQGRRLTPADCLRAPVVKDVLGQLRRGAARHLAYTTVLDRYDNYNARRNRLITSREFRDGSRLLTFVRYGDFAQADFQGLGRLLSDGFLDALERAGGASVVFVHWGRHSGHRFESLPPEGLAALKRLETRAREKRLWVTTTHRLLTYCHLRDTVGSEWDPGPERDRIRLELPGGDWSPRDLAGLSFRVPRPGRTDVVCGDRNLPVEAGDGCVTVAPPPLVFPDPP